MGDFSGSDMQSAHDHHVPRASSCKGDSPLWLCLCPGGEHDFKLSKSFSADFLCFRSLRRCWEDCDIDLDTSPSLEEGGVQCLGLSVTERRR